MYIDPVKYGGDMKNHERIHFFMRDIIRVRNPLSVDFTFYYDSIAHTVGAGKTKDFERYLAEKFFWDISQQIIGAVITEMGQKALDIYVKTNPNLLLDKYIENRNIWDKIPRPDDPKLQAAVAKNVIVGLVEKYGEVRMPQRQPTKLDRNTPLYQDLMGQLTSTPLSEMTPEQRAEVERNVPPGTPMDVVSERSMANEATIA